MFNRTNNVKLGNISTQIPFTKLPNNSGYFCYFKLNDHPDLVEEGARLIATRIQSLGVKDPFFITAEASTLALSHVLRDKYHINGLTLYKTRQLTDIDPISIEYDTVTATEPKKLYFDKNRLPELESKNIIIIDSVCTTGGTIQGILTLLTRAGVPSKNFVEATMLFAEGEQKIVINKNDNTQLPVHSFSYLPILTLAAVENNTLFSRSIPKLNIVIATESQIKIEAVKTAIEGYYKGQNINLNFKCVKTNSGVNEQPVELETVLGANNRLSHAKQLLPNADIYVSIENGIFRTGDHYMDKAIIKMKFKDEDEITLESKAVEFPAQYVEDAMKIGFTKITVGECMANAGVVKDSKDPHADLGDRKTRKTLLVDTIKLYLDSRVKLNKLESKAIAYTK